MVSYLGGLIVQLNNKFVMVEDYYFLEDQTDTKVYTIDTILN